MMACCEADILGSRCLDGSHPVVGIELRWVEASGKFLVLFVVEILVGHCPFARREHAVQSPVQEYSELGILKFLACFKVLLCGLILAHGFAGTCRCCVGTHCY